MRSFSRIASVLGFFVLTFSASAGDQTKLVAPLTPTALEVLEVSVTGTTAARMDTPGGGTVRQAETVADFEYLRRFNISDSWFLAFGASYEGFFFSRAERGLPTQLQSLAAVVALQYVVENQVAATIDVRPGFYFGGKLTSAAFDVPVTAYAPLQLSAKVFALIGARVSGFQNPPVLPVGGLIWLISDDLRLEAVFPQPRLVYSVGEHWEYTIGGEIAGGCYRLDRDDDAPPQLRGAVLQYEEYRAGVGVNFVRSASTTFGFDAGYIFERSLDYFRADRTYRSDGSFYGRLQCSWHF